MGLDSGDEAVVLSNHFKLAVSSGRGTMVSGYTGAHAQLHALASRDGLVGAGGGAVDKNLAATTGFLRGSAAAVFQQLQGNLVCARVFEIGGN
jgi:hypothetical protein